MEGLGYHPVVRAGPGPTTVRARLDAHRGTACVFDRTERQIQCRSAVCMQPGQQGVSCWHPIDGSMQPLASEIATFRRGWTDGTITTWSGNPCTPSRHERTLGRVRACCLASRRRADQPGHVFFAQTVQRVQQLHVLQLISGEKEDAASRKHQGMDSMPGL